MINDFMSFVVCRTAKPIDLKNEKITPVQVVTKKSKTISEAKCEEADITVIASYRSITTEVTGNVANHNTSEQQNFVNIYVSHNALKSSFVILILLFTTFFNAWGQASTVKSTGSNADTVYIPKDLEDCFIQIDKILPDNVRQSIATQTEDQFSATMHMGLGMWIRNNWGLWKGSRLSKYFNEKGIYHPDDMSGIILDSYYRHLTGKEIKLDEQIKHYQNYWEAVNQTRGSENSDESKILKNITLFKYFDQNVKSLKIPKRKYGPPFFCDEMIPYKNGFIINSITSAPHTHTQIDFTTNFYYYNTIDKSIQKFTISRADTIESVVSSGMIIYYSYIKNGKRDIGNLKDNQYQSLIDKASSGIRKHLDTTKWIKLGFENDKLFVLSPDYLFEVSGNEWKSLVNYSLDDFYTKTLKYERSISMLPTKNIVVKNNSVYFLQEIVRQRTCNLLKLNIASGYVEDYFISLDYRDYYSKEINDFTFLNDNSLLVSASRLMDNQMLINTKDSKVNVWAFNDSLTTFNGAKVELPVTTALNVDDTLILASNKGLYLKYADIIKTLVYFDDYHQTIKEKTGLLVFDFEPRDIKKLADNIYIIGGMWGGLYQVDILNNTLTCLDDVNSDKLKTVDLNDL